MSIDNYMSCACQLGELVVLVLLLRGGLWRRLPWFVAYVGWTLGSDLGLLALRTLPPETYYRIYTWEMVLDSALQFAVLTELIWSVLSPVRSSLPKSSHWFLLGIMALAGVVIWPLAGKTVPPELTNLGLLAFHLAQTFAILRVELFLMMASFSQLLSIGWKDRELQIATGMGFYAIVSLLVAVLHSHQMVGDQYHWLDRAASASYFCTLVYWVLVFARKDESRKEFSEQMREILVSIGVSIRTEGIPMGNHFGPDEISSGSKRD